MPIRESEKARYPKDWPAISKRIRERFAYCPWCGRRLTTYESTPGAPVGTPGGVP